MGFFLFLNFWVAVFSYYTSEYYYSNPKSLEQGVLDQANTKPEMNLDVPKDFWFLLELVPGHPHLWVTPWYSSPASFLLPSQDIWTSVRAIIGFLVMFLFSRACSEKSPGCSRLCPFYSDKGQCTLFSAAEEFGESSSNLVMPWFTF